MTNKKRYGIITFHRAINYGAILQVYALQKKIEHLGGKATVIDYRNNILENRHKKKLLSESKSLKELIKYFILYRHYNVKYDKFRSFSKKYINLSEVYFHKDEIMKEQETYNGFISGSDQVWNHNITGFDTTYFLDFAEENKKNSYAASFGISEISTELKTQYTSLLSDYKNMTIREKQGSEIIESLINQKAEVVLDPTLLLTKEEWGDLSTERILQDKYILIYGFGGSTNIVPLAKKLAKRKNAKVVLIGNSHKKDRDIIYMKSLGPKEWLSLFKYAEYIFTNSFHGTAFSINLNKNFFTELLPAKTGVNSRLEDILTLFNLEHRLIDSNNDKILDSEIDHNKVNEILSIERDKSIELLRKIIE